MSSSASATFYSLPFPLEDPLICGEPVVSRGSTLTAGLNLKRGQVVQYDPTTRLVKIPAAGAADAILAADCDATSGAKGCVIFVGGVFRYTGLIFDTTNNTIAAQVEQLRNMGIQIEAVMDVNGMLQPGPGILREVPAKEIPENELERGFAEAKLRRDEKDAEEKRKQADRESTAQEMLAEARQKKADREAEEARQRPRE